MKAERDPPVSIVMPVLDAMPFLAEAIDSVVAQEYAHWELLLDADDVWSAEMLARHVDRLRAEPAVGLLYSRTLYWHSWTEPQAGAADYVSPHLVTSGHPIDGRHLLELSLSGRASVPCTCSILVRRPLIDEVGGWDERFIQLYTDQAFYSKLFLATRVLPIDGCWAKYRQHPGSSTHTAARERRAREARLAFLSWLQAYVGAKGSIPPSLHRVLRRELWRCRHPVGDRLFDWLTYLRRRFERPTRT